MIDKETAIIAQSAGAQAATICAAFIAKGDDVDLDTFNSWRLAIFHKTLELAETDDAPSQAKRESKPSGKKCKHGPRFKIEGTNVKGDWVGWMCKLDREDPERCEPIFEDA